MRKSLLRILRDPHTKENLILFPFESNFTIKDDENIMEGILVGMTSKKAYPITNGIPVMFDDVFNDEFLNKHEKKITANHELSQLNLGRQRRSSWSFSDEWNEHFKADLRKTWGWSIKERVEQFFLETNLTLQECEGKLVLDAGCGNGQLSEALSELGMFVVGLDYSGSVFNAERRRRSPDVHFVQGDLQNPPFDTATFDLVISNGVLHHTPDTYNTFAVVARLVRPGGRFYLWLYRKSEKAFRRYVFVPVLDAVRSLIARMPRLSQNVAVKVYAGALMIMHSVLGKYKGERHRSWGERVVGAYDTLTPRFRKYHTPLEVSYWFFLNGYSVATLTHWDNPHGFGMVATKINQEDTPGVNFRKKEAEVRSWK